MNQNPIPELTPQLKALRLSGILDSLEARNRQAIEGKLAYTEFLAMLIGDEVARRENKKFSMRLRRAQFRATKTLEQFDFERLPKLNRALVHDLATGRYLHEKAPVLIVGPSGIGKSHLWFTERPRNLRLSVLLWLGLLAAGLLGELAFRWQHLLQRLH